VVGVGDSGGGDDVTGDCDGVLVVDGSVLSSGGGVVGFELVEDDGAAISLSLTMEMLESVDSSKLFSSNFLSLSGKISSADSTVVSVCSDSIISGSVIREQPTAPVNNKIVAIKIIVFFISCLLSVFGSSIINEHSAYLQTPPQLKRASTWSLQVKSNSCRKELFFISVI